ncbi:Protein kinase C-binding protein NELL1 [Lemmus lemmus]
MQMDVILVLWFCVCTARTVLGFGMDPDLQMDIITELDLVNTTLGVTQVAGLHNASKAFLFQDVQREIHSAPHVSEKLIQLFRNKSEFTFLATVQQKPSTSGVILSIRELEHSYFELESSGPREEIRYHYIHRGKPRTEALPYRMADGQWHKVALSVSASHLLLHVDCNRIYERVIDPPETNLPPGSNLWLGQRNQKHGFFKGIIQDGKIIFMPNGFITQCPNLNRTCPTCSDFLSLVQGIMDLQELLAKMTAKVITSVQKHLSVEKTRNAKTGIQKRPVSARVDTSPCRATLRIVKILMSVQLRCTTAMPTQCVSTCRDYIAVTASQDTSVWMTSLVRSMTTVAVDSTTVTKMPSAPTPSRDTAVPASRATWEMAPSAEHSARRAADTEVPAWLLTSASALLDSQEATARKILMNVQRDSLSATTTPAALTCQGGTTVSAEAVSMTMGPTHCPGSPALTLTNVP